MNTSDTNESVETLKLKIQELQEEIKACKEFFGYDYCMSLDDIKYCNDEAEEEEKGLRETDEEYDRICTKSEELSDLVIELGKYQYEVAGLYSSLKKLFFNDDSSNWVSKRKSFISSFLSLKESVSDDNLEQFFDIMSEWVDYQRQISQVDIKIAKLQLD